MAYFVADEKLQGYYVSGGVTINIVKYHFECDDAASLPAQTAFISSKNVKISMASTAHTIDTDALYKMDSSGAWVQQSQPWKPLADYSVLTNKPQINGHTLTGNQSGADLGLQNTLTFDSTPTQNSTNPVTSGGIWTDQQMKIEGIELQSGDDLNDLTRGRYYCRSATVSAGIANNPNTGSGFVLDHMYNVGNSVQILYPSSSSNTVIYKRAYASNAWRPWCVFTGTVVP